MKKLIMLIMVAFACTAWVFTSAHDKGKTCKAAEHSQVIVVGAGMAGLTSAVTLAKNGIDAILLEKENSVGGKLFSTVLDGINSNVGTQWLFPNIHPLINYYMELLPLQPIESEGIIWEGKFYMLSGNINDASPTTGPLADLALAYEQLYVDWKLAQRGKEWFFDREPESNLWNTIEQMNCHEYLSKFPEDVYDYFNAELGGETGGDIRNLSAIVLVGWEGDPDTGKFIVKGGNQVLAQKMAEDFTGAGGRLYLNSEVTDIEQDGNSASVRCSDGREFTADYAIVATPADIANNIVNNLSAEKAEALEAVGYAQILEVALHVKNFPSGKNLGVVLCVGECINGFINQTGSVAGNPATGTIISACVTDPEMLKLDDGTIAERIANVLRKVNPGFSPESDILNYSIKKWAKGVFECPPGFASRYQKALRAPSGRIFFAGDYTGDPSLMGAAWSGSRAAKAIREALPPILSIEPGTLQAGSGFSLEIMLTQNINIPFDFYLFADTQFGPYTLSFDGKVKKGIQALYRNIQGFKGPFEKTVIPNVILPVTMGAHEVTFYAVAVQAGKMPRVSRLSDLSADTSYVILFYEKPVTVKQ